MFELQAINMFKMIRNWELKRIKPGTIINLDGLQLTFFPALTAPARKSMIWKHQNKAITILSISIDETKHPIAVGHIHIKAVEGDFETRWLDLYEVCPTFCDQITSRAELKFAALLLNSCLLLLVYYFVRC